MKSSAVSCCPLALHKAYNLQYSTVIDTATNKSYPGFVLPCSDPFMKLMSSDTYL